MIVFTHTEFITTQKKFKSINDIFNTQKKCMKSKKVALKNKVVFFIQEILDITCTVETKTKIKKNVNSHANVQLMKHWMKQKLKY